MIITTADGLRAPRAYVEAGPMLRAAVCNGCGTKGWKGTLVPNTLYGLSVMEACNIHDWMYAFGKDESDRLDADAIFLSNMIRHIDRGAWALRWLRRRRAYKYFEAVRTFGKGPFNNAKPPED